MSCLLESLNEFETELLTQTWVKGIYEDMSDLPMATSLS